MSINRLTLCAEVKCNQYDNDPIIIIYWFIVHFRMYTQKENLYRFLSFHQRSTRPKQKLAVKKVINIFRFNEPLYIFLPLLSFSAYIFMTTIRYLWIALKRAMNITETYSKCRIILFSLRFFFRKGARPYSYMLYLLNSKYLKQNLC